MKLISRQRHPRDPFFHEVRIVLRERWKESEMSGDEWRFSYRILLCRHGLPAYEKVVNDFVYACTIAAAAVQLSVCELSEQGFEPTSKEWHPDKERGYCCQPGCDRPSVVWYRMARQYSSNCCLFEDIDPERHLFYREFCEKHRDRGDCGLDDAMTNYVEISRPE